MSRKSPGAPTWFRTLGSWENILKFVPYEIVGEAFLATLKFFNDPNSEIRVSERAETFYLAMAASAKESWAEYQAAVENGLRGQEVKQANAKKRGQGRGA